MSTSDRSPAHPALDEDAAPLRQCGRCRGFFPIDDTPDSVSHPKWWLCPPCHEKLIGSRPSKLH